MKILFISEFWPPVTKGGGEQSAFLLAKGLVKKGIKVHVLTSKFGGMKTFELMDNIKVYRLLTTGKRLNSFFSNIKRALIFPISVKFYTKKLLRESGYDLVHYLNTTSILGKVKTKVLKVAHVNSPVLFCPKGTLMLADEKECPLKCNFSIFLKCFLHSREFGKLRNKFYFKYNPFLIIYLYYNFKKRQLFLKNFDFYFPISKFMQNKLIESGVNKEKTIILPNIVETERFSIEKTKNKIPKILYTGAYLENKGCMILLEALKDLNLKYECNFFGSGDLKNDLVSFVSKNKLNVKINNKLPYSQMPKVFSEHDIIVFPSLIPEAFGRVAIEAMASSKPVIGSNIGGIKYIIKNKENGLLVEPGNILELKNAIIELIKNKPLKNKLIKNGIRDVEKYSSDVISEKILKEYRKLLK